MYKYTARYAKGHLRIWIQNTEYSFCEKGYTNEKNTNLKLTEEQQHAYDMVENAIDDYMNSEFLLYGVTGSR